MQSFEVDSLLYVKQGGIRFPDGTIQNTASFGVQGPQGIAGSQGTTGIQGLAGVQGTTGSVGPQGATGSTGPQGFTGTTGSQGTTGANGLQGSTGSTGLQGITGSQGTTGVQGSTGSQGTTGSIGATGPQGSTGPQGAIGSQGTMGASGATGPQGSTGIQGSTGLQGPTGPQGVSGGFTTNSNAEVNSLGVGVSASGVQGTIRVSNSLSIIHNSNALNFGEVPNYLTYAGIYNPASNNYVLMTGATDRNVYISSDTTNGAVFIRNGINDSSKQVVVGSSGVSINGALTVNSAIVTFSDGWNASGGSTNRWWTGVNTFGNLTFTKQHIANGTFDTAQLVLGGANTSIFTGSLNINGTDSVSRISFIGDTGFINSSWHGFSTGTGLYVPSTGHYFYPGAASNPEWYIRGASSGTTLWFQNVSSSNLNALKSVSGSVSILNSSGVAKQVFSDDGSIFKDTWDASGVDGFRLGGDGTLTLRTTAPTIYFRDRTNSRSAAIHFTNSFFYILRHGSLDISGWDDGPNNRHPMTMNMATGDVTFSGAVNEFSDQSLKFSIRNYTDYKDKLLRLQPRQYIMDGEDTFGLVAQEVEESFPEIVKRVGETELLGLNYSRLTVPLIAGWQDHEKRIEQLEKEKESLKNEIQNLTSRLELLERSINIKKE